MKVKAKQLFVSPKFGNVQSGDVITVSDEEYKHLLEIGVVEKVETKAKPKVKASDNTSRSKRSTKD